MTETWTCQLCHVDQTADKKDLIPWTSMEDMLSENIKNLSLDANSCWPPVSLSCPQGQINKVFLTLLVQIWPPVSSVWQWGPEVFGQWHSLLLSNTIGLKWMCPSALTETWLQSFRIRAVFTHSRPCPGTQRQSTVSLCLFPRLSLLSHQRQNWRQQQWTWQTIWRFSFSVLWCSCVTAEDVHQEFRT